MNEEKNKIEKLKLIKKIALEYRLSLKNICKLLNIDPTEENQQLIYNAFITNPEILHYSEISKFKYLVYETSGEKIQNEKISYSMAQIAILKIKKAKLSQEKEQFEHAKQNFRQIDTDFMKLKRRDKWTKVTEEEILTITKYRIKHALSKMEISRLIGIGTDTISKYEELITSKFWSSKVQLLNNYNFDVCHTNIKEKRKASSRW